MRITPIANKNSANPLTLSVEGNRSPAGQVVRKPWLMRNSLDFILGLVIALLCLAGGVDPLRASTYADFNILSGTTVNLYGKLHTPTNYSGTNSTTYPLVIVFHGTGETYAAEIAGNGPGNTWQVTRNIGNLYNNVEGKAFLYAPQAPSTWLNSDVMKNVLAGVAKIMSEYKIAPDQLYVTGLSLGGCPVWTSLISCPIWAAGVPISGVMPIPFGGSPANMLNVPIWAFASRDDTTVPVTDTHSNINSIFNVALTSGTIKGTQWPICSSTSNPFYNNGSPYYTGSLADPDTSGFPSTYLSPETVPAFDCPNLKYTEFGAGGHNIWDKVYSEGIPNVSGTSKYPLYSWLWAQRKTVSPALQGQETILFDFGKYSLANEDNSGRGTDSLGRTWNCTGKKTGGSGPEKTLGMMLQPALCVTGSGRQTLVGIKITGTFKDVITIGGTTGMLYDGDISRDGFMTAASGTAAMTICNLNPGVAYQFAIYATGTDSDGAFGRNTGYQIGSGSTSNLNAYNNVNGRAFLTGTAASDGTITIKVMPISGSRYGMISAMEISLASGPSDTTSPLVAITSPISGSMTTSGTVALTGTAGDNVGVSSIAWSNNRGGGGATTGTSPWTFSNIALQTGVNVLTVTATDAALNTGTASVAVIYNQPPDAPSLSGTLDEESSMNVDVVGACSDPDSWPSPISVVSFGLAGHGVALNQSGTMNYTPTRGYYGPDTVTYVVTDGTAQTTGTVGFQVVNTAAYMDLYRFGLGGSNLGLLSGGTSRELATGEWEVSGTGLGLSGTGDSVHGEFKSVCGDFVMKVKVNELQGAMGTRTGLVAREGFGAGARMVGISIGTDNVIRYGVRVASSGTAVETSVGGASPIPGTWLRITKAKNTLSAATSLDDITYTTVVTQDLAQLGSTLQAGPWVTGGSGGGVGRGVLNLFSVNQSTVTLAQSFDQWGSAGTSTGAYVTGTNPAFGQFNEISAEAFGGAWSIESGTDAPNHSNGRLKLVRPVSSGSNTGAGFTRLSGTMAGAPKQVVSFKVGISGINTNSDLWYLDLGSLLTLQGYSNTTPNAGMSNRLTFKGTGSGLFLLRLNGTNSVTTYPANGTEVQVKWYLNHTATQVTYQSPDTLMTTGTLGPGKCDLWINGTKIFDEYDRPVVFGATTTTGVRMRTTTDQPMTMTIEDLDLSPLP